MYTQDDWSQYEDMQNELDKFGNNYIDEFYNDKRGNYFFEQAQIENDTIIITYEWSCMGGHETEVDTIPLHCLWSENWIELAKADKERERIRREKAEHDRLIAKRNKEIADEQAKYLELKAKYGDTNEIK